MSTKTPKQPLDPKNIASSVATGGGGTLFQARVAALYLANMLTGRPTALGLNGGCVETLRMEARFTGANTDDICCALVDGERRWKQFIQCKLSLDATAGDTEFKESMFAAWRDFLGNGPFERATDFIVIVTASPASESFLAAKRICELSRASVDVTDLQNKLDAKGLLRAQHLRTWNALVEVSSQALSADYSVTQLFELLRRLRFDIHDLGTDKTQEAALIQSLLSSSEGKGGDLIWPGLVNFCLEQGQQVGTITLDTWAACASAELRAAVAAQNAAPSPTANGLSQMAARSKLQLELISTSLPTGVHLPRSNLASRLLEGFDAHQLVIAVGGPGVGKSAVVSGVAPMLAESGPVYFFRADDLEHGSLNASLNVNGQPNGLLALQASLAAYPRTFIVLDSVEKVLEFQQQGAFEELLALVRRYPHAKLLVTCRSYALSPVYGNFFHPFSFEMVNVPRLDDSELDMALAGTALFDDVRSDAKLRDVLRTPFYLRLAMTFHERTTLLSASTQTDIRLRLWSEHVAPSADGASGLAQRRRLAFDEVCFQRTGKFSQFVGAPPDSEAVTALINDEVLAQDSVGRVAPAHDVFEDWSLFFRIEREVRSCERDWDALFVKLGTHAGLRRAFRTWVSERTAENDQDATALLKHCLAKGTSAPPIWRDEALIGVLRSPVCEAVLEHFKTELFEDGFELLKRLVHLLRVACKGPTGAEVGSPPTETSMQREIRFRHTMTAPIGSGWLSVVRLLESKLADIPESAWSWVIGLLEDALGAVWKWHVPTELSKTIFVIADHYTSNFDEPWYDRNPVQKRFFALFVATGAGNIPRLQEVVAELLTRRATAITSDARDFASEDKLKFVTSFEHSKELALFAPDLLLGAFTTLYVGRPPKHGHFDHHSHLHKEEDFGLSELAENSFYPESAMQGPFRQVLGYQFTKGLKYLVEFLNAAAKKYADSPHGGALSIPAEFSPNGRPHLHRWEFWVAYRGMGVTSHLLNSVLMSLEEKLLSLPTGTPDERATLSTILRWILEHGESSFTTGVVASVMVARPEVVDESLLPIFKSPEFLLVDNDRGIHEGPGSALFGGLAQGFDKYRVEERLASSKLPHRKWDLERLLLKLQIDRPDLATRIHAILDSHPMTLAQGGDDTAWAFLRGRMDVRKLRLGPVVHRTEDSAYRKLEVVDVDPKLAKIAADAQVGAVRLNRRAGLHLWAVSVLEPTPSTQSYRTRFVDCDAAIAELREINAAENVDDAGVFGDLELEVSAAICLANEARTPSSLQWAKDVLISEAVAERCADAKFAQRSRRKILGRALVVVLSLSPNDSTVFKACTQLGCDDDQEVRIAFANEVAESLWPVAEGVAFRLAVGLSIYAGLVGDALRHPYPQRQTELRAVSAQAFAAIQQSDGTEPPETSALTDTAFNPMDWLIAIYAVPANTRCPWRDDILLKLAKKATAQELGKPSRRRQGDRHAETRELESGELRTVAVLLAAVLLEHADEPTHPAMACFEQSLKFAPGFAGSVLERALSAEDKTGFEHSAKLWRLWDLGAAACFGLEDIRHESRRYRSSFDELLQVLLLASIQWNENAHRIEFLAARPDFVSTSLTAVGDTCKGFLYCAQLADGIGRDFAVPQSLLAFRDAIKRAPSDLFDDDNTRWYLETICRLAVHDHRGTVLADAKLRRASLDVLDSLVDAGSSLAFQLRDYLATSPGASS